jgi:hypothetical protein
LKNVKPSATILDSTGFLERTGSNGDACAARTEHTREELVGERERVGMHAILSHENPAIQTLVDFVQAVASGNLLALQGLNVAEAE